MGRRSLLLHRKYTGDSRELLHFMLCSTLTKEIQDIYPMEEWVEVPSDKIYSVSLPISLLENEPPEFDLTGNAEDINGRLFNYYFDGIQSHEWKLPFSRRIESETRMIEQDGKESFELVIPEMYLPYGTRTEDLITESEIHTDEEFNQAVNDFLKYLENAVKRRVDPLPQAHPHTGSCRGGEARLAIMFSGGIDSMLVAALATKYFPSGEPIEYYYYYSFLSF